MWMRGAKTTWRIGRGRNGSVRGFGSDYVLLRAESELGVQTVQLHRLELPAID